MNDKNVRNGKDPSLDVFITVNRPDDQIREIVGRILKQTVKVSHIYLLVAIRHKRSNDLEMSDGILNFSYENGKLRFNGIQTDDNDIIHFDDFMEGNQIPVEIVYISEKQMKDNGILDEILKLSEAEYVMVLNQNTLPLNRVLIRDLLVPLESNTKNVACLTKYVPSKGINGLEKAEYGALNKCLKGNKKRQVNRLPISLFFDYNGCALYKMDVLKDCIRDIQKKANLFNSDILLLESILKKGYYVTISSQMVAKRKNTSAGYLFCRSLHMYDLCERIRGFDAYGGNSSMRRSLIKISFVGLLKRGRIHNLSVFFGCRFIEIMGFLAADMYKKVPDQRKGKFLTRMHDLCNKF